MSGPLKAGDEPILGYVLVRPLGRGGFGEVWEATAPGGVRVALKFIRLGGGHDASERRALQSLRDIRHPHLLDVHFATLVEDYFVIAMPLCDRSLKDRLETCKAEGLPGIPRDELMGYMAEAAEAIDYLNEPRHPSGLGDGRLVGVQHRDIKPHNVFLVGGSARVADFGLAKALEATRGEHSGAMSPHYAAPEMIQGRVSPWSDQYSLAVSYVHLRTGHLPFSGGSVHQYLYAHVHEPPDLSALPGAERPAVARALTKAPEGRWPDCRSFVHDLREATLAGPDRLDADSTDFAFGPGRPDPVEDPTPSRGPTSPPPASTLRSRDWVRPGVDSGPSTREDRPRRPGPAITAAALAGLAALVAATLLRGGRESPARPRLDPPKAERTRADPGPPAIPPDPEPPANPPVSVPEPPTPPGPEGKLPSPPTEPVAFIPPAGTGPKLAGQARAILKRYCQNCHGVKFEKPPLDVLDPDVLLAKPPSGGKRSLAYITPGKPDDSLLWKRLGVDEDMPPEDPTPTADEKATLRRWIEAGAGFPDDSGPRPFVTEADVLTAIRNDLEKAAEADRPFRRYFTLANLQADRKISDDDLNLARAALAKLVNSLSWKPRIVVPRAVDPNRVVFAVDLRDLGWDRGDVWRRIIRNESAPKGGKFEGARDEARKGYPYGLTHPGDAEAEVRRLAGDVHRLAGTQVPAIRADWFIATASRPPLYEEILGLPTNARELERKLGVDFESNFLRDQLARAGFSRSGVSSHNRMVERHEAGTGAYWKSYDFKLDEGEASLARFPLGPEFATNPFPKQAFEHAGGELIFNLPNGLQAYLLVDGKDRRIAAGPIEVVGDALKTSGTATIVNGLSCMACHKEGMIAEFADEIRRGTAVGGEARAKVERLYPDKPEMDRLLADDSSRFLSALEKAIGPFLKVGPDKDRPIRDFPEPIGAVARIYVKDLGLDAAAAELGLKDPKALRDAIRANPELRRLGLGPLLQEGGQVKRSAWESLKFLNTPFQDAAIQLGLGTPFHEL